MGNLGDMVEQLWGEVYIREYGSQEGEFKSYFTRYGGQLSIFEEKNDLELMF